MFLGGIGKFTNELDRTHGTSGGLTLCLVRNVKYRCNSGFTPSNHPKLYTQESCELYTNTLIYRVIYEYVRHNSVDTPKSFKLCKQAHKPNVYSKHKSCLTLSLSTLVFYSAGRMKINLFKFVPILNW